MDSTNLVISDKLINHVGLSAQDLPSPALYVVGLPIGNLADISLRALWVLSHANVIAAEDTRETRKILDKFNISAEVTAVHQHNEHEGAAKILAYLEAGKMVAMVTDAGTPAVSDPGTKVVREITDAGYRVIPIPGASAVVTAISAAGMEPEGFIFYGFLNGGAQERRGTLGKLIDTHMTFVLYEAPHRIIKLCEELTSCLRGHSLRRIVIARELTKKFETIVVSNSEALEKWASTHKPQGEYVIVVNAQEKHTSVDLDPTTEKWLRAFAGTMPPKVLASTASDITGLPKKMIYEFLISLKDSETD